MPETTYELIILCVILFANAVLALAEVALVSIPKSRLDALSEAESKRAKDTANFAHDLPSHLQALRVACTTWCIFLGAVPGAWLTEKFATLFQPFTHGAVWGNLLAAIAAAFVLSAALLIFGELIPRRIAVAYPEKIALWLTPTVKRTSAVISPILKFLNASLERVLRMFGVKRPRTEALVSDDEVNRLLEEGMTTGVFNKAEKEMVAGVLELDKLPVTAIMTPRPKIVFLNVEDPDEVNWRKIVASGHSYFPVYQGNRDQVLGMVAVKALWAHSAINLPTTLKNLLVSPLVVPETMSAIHLLEAFKKAGKHIALVTDEFGAIQGLTTLIDVLEAIVGDIPSMGPGNSPAAKQREDGSWLIDATLSAAELKNIIKVDVLPDEDRAAFQTAGGFVVTRLGHIPTTAEFFDFGEWRFEVVDMDRHRVDKILLTRRASGNTQLDQAAS